MSTTAKNPSTAKKKAAKVAESLNLVLPDSSPLMAALHLAHWTVEGEDFFPLHKAFQEQYENLFEAIDEIAERVRALNVYAVGGLNALGKLANIEELKWPLPQKDYVAALIVVHEKTTEDALRTRELAESANDLETQDLMIKRLQWHEKT